MFPGMGVVHKVSKVNRMISVKNDSVFAKKVLTYRENRGNPGYSHMNVFIVSMENYTFLEW